VHVLYFHQHFSTPAGSTGTRSYEFAKRLIASGHEVTMVCGTYSVGNTGLVTPFVSGRREGEVEGVRIIEFHYPYSNNDGFLGRSVTFLKYAFRRVLVLWQKSHDLVFATSTPLTAGIPGIFARWFRRTPFVFEVRDLWPELPSAMGVITNPVVLWLMGVLEWLSYYSASRTIGLSPGIVKGIESRGIDITKIEMVPNGCDLELFSPDGDASFTVPEIDEHDHLAVFPGAHGLANGLDQLLDVAAELLKLRRMDIKLLFVEEGSVKGKLISEAKDRGLTNCVFLDAVPKIELAKLLRRADVGLMVLANVPAFYYGTSPNKFFDYISSGLPVINNYPGWLAELIDQNSCGVVVAPGDSKHFAEKIIEICDDAQGKEVMTRSARELAVSSFNRKQLANKFVDVLERVCVANGHKKKESETPWF
jgi:glycosyltransferase involved in cell wall biosynthesis